MVSLMGISGCWKERFFNLADCEDFRISALF